LRAGREEPQPPERKLDVVPPTLAEIDQRIATEVVAHLQGEWVVGRWDHQATRGEQGPPGKLPLVKLWVPETVYYEGDVVAYGGGTFQAKRDTGQSPSHADWVCLATVGRDGKTIAVRGTREDQRDSERESLRALTPEVVAARIALRVAELRLLAAWTSVLAGRVWPPEAQRRVPRWGGPISGR
jgi:hypothetical protein